MKIDARNLAALGIAWVLATGTVFAQKPDSGAHKAKQGSSRSGNETAPSKTADIGAHVYFTDERIRLITDYYSSRPAAAGCPPGLAKKGNGCRPPGQAKKWRVGAPLPSHVIYHDVPDALVVELGLSDTSRKIVRVGTDLLLIAVGTGMVIDSIEDLDDLF